jgi:hypothetical protein
LTGKIGSFSRTGYSLSRVLLVQPMTVKSPGAERGSSSPSSAGLGCVLASLSLRSRLNRALSPWRADMAPLPRCWWLSSPRNRIPPAFALIHAITHNHSAAVNRITGCLPDSARGMGEVRRATDINLHFSSGFVARRVRRPWIRGARRSARGGVLGQYVEHGDQAQRRRHSLITRRSRKSMRNAG